MDRSLSIFLIALSLNSLFLNTNSSCAVVVNVLLTRPHSFSKELKPSICCSVKEETPFAVLVSVNLEMSNLGFTCNPDFLML